MFEDKHHVREYIYTYQDTEEVNGRTYHVVYSMVLDDITSVCTRFLSPCASDPGET